MKDSLHTIIYATILGTVCAVLLTGAQAITAPYKESNARAEKMRNILEVLEVPFDSEVSSQELVKIFEENVRVEDHGGLTTYSYVPPGKAKTVQAVAVAFAGPGVWAPIKGFLSLEPDMRTIRGITFHEQEETPGLGGEIASAWFRNQFKGKKIISPEGAGGIRLVRGGASKPNEVDAITGATMTCRKVEAMLNALIQRIIEEQGRNVQ